MVEGPASPEVSNVNIIHTENIYFKSNLIIIFDEDILDIRRIRELVYPICWYNNNHGAWNPFIKLVVAWHTACLDQTSESYVLNCFTDQMSAKIRLRTIGTPIYADKPMIISYDSFDYNGDTERRVIFNFVGMTTDNLTRPLKDFFLASLAKYGNDGMDNVEDIIRPFEIEIIREGQSEWVVKNRE